MLHLDGNEEESESEDNNYNNKDKNNKKNINEEIKENSNINNKKEKTIKKISKDNFFKDDSNNYEIISNLNENEDNNKISKNKEENEIENSEGDINNFTEIEDKDDYINNNKENEKENEQNSDENDELNNSNKSSNLKNKDNNNNSIIKNKDNNSEENEKEIQIKSKQNSIVNNSINITNKINDSTFIVNTSNENNNKSLANNKDNNNNNDNRTSSMNNNNINKIKSSLKKDDNDNSNHYNDGWSYSETNKENENTFINQKDSNLRLNLNEEEEEEDEEEIKNNNKNNQSNISNKNEIKDSKENNNINKNEKENNISRKKEESDNKEEEKINSINQEKNNDEQNQNNSFSQKYSIRLTKSNISTIKNNNSNEKDQNSQSDENFFSSRSNSGKSEKNNKINDNKQNQIKNENNEEEIKITVPKKVELKNFKNNSKTNINKDNDNNKKLSDSINEINLVKDEYYINYIKNKRKGFKDLIEKNYVQGYNSFSECYELSTKYLKNKIKQIDSLINMSICEYYNGNFQKMVSLLDNAKNIFNTVSLGECRISPRDKIRLGIKLYTYSSMANLSTNNYISSINDIKKVINLIEPENDIDKKLALFKYVLYTLFKVETLLNIQKENEILANIKNNYNYVLSDKNLINLNNSKSKEIIDNNSENINEKIINEFLACLKYKDTTIILNSFIENAPIYKKNKNMTGYYFCIFNQYLITYNNVINENKKNQENNNLNKEEQIKEMKERLFICYKNLLGEEISTEIKDINMNKDVIQFLKEFKNKMECSYEIFNILENYEKTINQETQDLYKEKKDNKYLNNTKLKNKLKNKEELHYPAKLCLKYSLYYIRKKKITLENDNSEEAKKTINNMNSLIKELEILIEKISNYEVDTSFLQQKHINPDLIKNIYILFDNLIYIYYKSLLHKYFHIFRKKALNIKLTENLGNIDNFLSKNYDIISKDMRLIKVNYNSKSYKFYFYRIDPYSNTLNVREIENSPYPLKSFNLFKDVIKITYGPRSKNLIYKLKNKKEADSDTRKFLRSPWKFISFILKKKSIDLYCENDQVDNWFYGMKDFTEDNSVDYKIASTNKYVLNKIKYRIAMKLKIGIKEGIVKEEKHKDLINRLIKEEAFHYISFSRLILLYNKLMKL